MRGKKSSDSDYKAEDEGSASDNKANKIKPIKKVPTGPKHLKKELPEKLIMNLVPQGVMLSKSEPLTQEQYTHLLELPDAKEFSLNYKNFLGKISKVTDGDTVKVLLYFDGNYTKFILRLHGIDTPECKSGTVKEFGKKVKDILNSMLEGKIVRIETGNFEKYGRVLARVFAFSQGKEFCVNDYLVEHRLAKAYWGKTKNEFNSEDYEEFMEQHEEKVWPVVENYPYASQ